MSCVYIDPTIAPPVFAYWIHKDFEISSLMKDFCLPHDICLSHVELFKSLWPYSLSLLEKGKGLLENKMMACN